MFQPTSVQRRILKTVRLGMRQGFELLSDGSPFVDGGQLTFPDGVPHSVLRALLKPTSHREGERYDFDRELADDLRELTDRGLLKAHAGSTRVRPQLLRLNRPDGMVVEIRKGRKDGFAVTIIEMDRTLCVSRDYGTELLYKLEPKGFDLLDALAGVPERPDDPGPGRKGTKRTVPEFAFSRMGDSYYVVGFGEQGFVGTNVGLGRIAMMLGEPGVPVPQLTLIGGAGAASAPRDIHSHQPALDGDAKRQLREKMRELDAELDDARERNDLAQVERVTHEKEELEAFVGASLGLGDRDRDLNSPAKSAGPAIHNSLARAYKAMQKAGLSRLVDHLQSSIHEEGETFVYDPPDPPPEWSFNFFPVTPEVTE